MAWYGVDGRHGVQFVLLAWNIGKMPSSSARYGSPPLTELPNTIGYHGSHCTPHSDPPPYGSASQLPIFSTNASVFELPSAMLAMLPQRSQLVINPEASVPAKSM